MNEIRAVLFDSGDTLVGPRGGRWNPRFDFEDVLLRHVPHAPVESFPLAFLAGERWLQSPQHTSDRDDYHRVVLAELGIEPTPALLADLAAPITTPVFEPFPDVRRVLDRLRDARIKLAIVTNNWGTSASFLELMSQIELGDFDACVVSAEIGCSKPDPRIYHAASDALGLQPEQCLFVDDVPALVKAAIDLGYQAVTIARRDSTIHPVTPIIRSLDEILPIVGVE